MKSPWQISAERPVEISVAAGKSGVSPAMEETQAACDQCGAVLAYQPGSQSSVCEYCGASSQFDVEPVEIIEHDYRDGLNASHGEQISHQTQAVSCQSCQAEFTFDDHLHAGECPFCGHAIVAGSSDKKQIKPAAILPFSVGERDAREDMRDWLNGLWFAPSKLQDMARTGGRMHGMYLPFWTYDSLVFARYSGQRGDIYYEPQYVSVVENGRRRTVRRMVQKVRWSSVRGAVERHFNDELVLASRSLPEWMANRLGPWDMGALKPYSPRFVQGFQAESYNISLEQGFETAENTMRSRILADVRVDIGGDLQRVRHVDLKHSDIRFKHILLPLWLGVYRYRGRNFHVSVNGQTGEVQGERPYSIIKIAALALFMALILFVIFWIGTSQPLPM